MFSCDSRFLLNSKLRNFENFKTTKEEEKQKLIKLNSHKTLIKQKW